MAEQKSRSTEGQKGLMGGWREGAALAPRWAGVFFSRAEKNQKAEGRVEKRPVGTDGRIS